MCFMIIAYFLPQKGQLRSWLRFTVHGIFLSYDLILFKYQLITKIIEKII